MVPLSFLSSWSPEAVPGPSSLPPLSPFLGAAALLTAKEDHYGGVIIDPDSLPSSVPEFTSALHRSLDRWRQEGKKGIWLQVPTSKVALVAPAVEQGGAWLAKRACG